MVVEQRLKNHLSFLKHDLIMNDIYVSNILFSLCLNIFNDILCALCSSLKQT